LTGICVNGYAEKRVGLEYQISELDTNLSTLQSEYDSLLAQYTESENCSQAIQSLAESYFVHFTPGYRRDTLEGYCVRSTDGEYDESLSPDLFTEGASLE
jgi:hypothetical protein